MSPNPLDLDTSNFIANKRSALIEKIGAEHIKQFNGFYHQMPFQDLADIFSLLHFKINELFKEINRRNVSGLYPGYFKAENSRSLLYLIDEIKLLKANLNDTQCSFEVNSEYEEKLNKCEGFLLNGGCNIPNDFNKIEIIENKGIFVLKESVLVHRFNKGDSFLLKQIGSGSYAIVSKYRDEYYDRNFAIKKARHDLNEKEYERFKIEYEVMKKLNSPYVIEVYKFDEINRQYIMENADDTLENYITKNNNKITMDERINIVKQIIRAFLYIHSKKVLHRDISTKNILIKKYEELVVVKVSDFGLVKQEGSNLTSKNTEFKGSLNDPKLEIIGFNNFEVRHEIYSFTRLIYFVITGKITMALKETALAPDVKKFFNKGINDNINERYGSIEDFQKAFIKIASLLDKKEI